MTEDQYTDFCNKHLGGGNFGRRSSQYFTLGRSRMLDAICSEKNNALCMRERKLCNFIHFFQATEDSLLQILYSYCVLNNSSWAKQSSRNVFL